MVFAYVQESPNKSMVRDRFAPMKQVKVTENWNADYERKNNIRNMDNIYLERMGRKERSNQ